MIYKIIWYVGVVARNPSYFKLKKKLKALSDLDKRQRELYVLERLEIIKKATSTWSYPNFNVDTSAYMTKEDLRNAEGCSSVPHQRHFRCETSGSSGEVLKFPRNEVWDSINRVTIDLFKEKHGVNPYDRTIYFWGISSGFWTSLKTRFFDVLMNRRRIFTYNEAELVSFARKNQGAMMIEGYSSSINELAKVCIKYGLEFSNLKLVKATSEKIFPEYRQNVAKAFNVRLYGEYGSAETGLIGFECSAGNYHVQESNVSISVDENNEIVVTNLWSESFPVINYKLGDYVTLSPSCICGKNSPVITSIDGRVGKKIEGSNYSYPSLFLYYVFKVLTLEYNITLTYVAVQHKKGELTVHLNKTISEEELIKLRRIFHSYFENDLVIIVEFGLPERIGKKQKDFISYV